MHECVCIWPFDLIIADIKTWVIKSPGAFTDRHFMTGYMHVDEI